MIKNICTYCSSHNNISEEYRRDAERLGTLLGEAGCNVINGAGSIGLMKIISDATLLAGGTVTGVIPRFMIAQGICHQGLTQLIAVDTMHERKQTMVSLSDAVVALPGGYGTLEELLEIITWRQLGLYSNPVIILNTNGFYTPLLSMLKHATDEKFILAENLHIAKFADSPEEVLQLLQ